MQGVMLCAHPLRLGLPRFFDEIDTDQVTRARGTEFTNAFCFHIALLIRFLHFSKKKRKMQDGCERNTTFFHIFIEKRHLREEKNKL
jgi:hypothetical protein